MESSEEAALDELENLKGAKLWSGQMKCIVISLIDVPLAGVIITHKLGKTQDRGGAENYSLNPGVFFDFTINVGSGHSDLWDIWTKDINGNVLSRYGKKCDVESSDISRELPMYIILGKKPAGFSIQLPSSSSCMGNHY